MVTSLDLDPFTRSLWGEYDAYVIGQLETLAYDPCYSPRLYVAPDLTSSTIAASQYQPYGLEIAAGSIIYGLIATANQAQITQQTSFMVQITDVSLGHKFFDSPVPGWFVGNRKGFFPNLWPCQHPVTGSGLFNVEIWNQLSVAQLVQIIFCVLEPCQNG
jgi:hypothetical protein